MAKPSSAWWAKHIRGRAGIAAKVFQAVAGADINVHMISQGASEINISFVVEESDVPRAVQRLHQRFFEAGCTGRSRPNPAACCGRHRLPRRRIRAWRLASHDDYCFRSLQLPDTPATRSCKVALVGFGTVGSSVARLLYARGEEHSLQTHACLQPGRRSQESGLDSAACDVDRGHRRGAGVRRRRGRGVAGRIAAGA